MVWTYQKKSQGGMTTLDGDSGQEKKVDFSGKVGRWTIDFTLGDFEPTYVLLFGFALIILTFGAIAMPSITPVLIYVAIFNALILYYLAVRARKKSKPFTTTKSLSSFG